MDELLQELKGDDGPVEVYDGRAIRRMALQQEQELQVLQQLNISANVVSVIQASADAENVPSTVSEFAMTVEASEDDQEDASFTFLSYDEWLPLAAADENVLEFTQTVFERCPVMAKEVKNRLAAFDGWLTDDLLNGITAILHVRAESQEYRAHARATFWHRNEKPRQVPAGVEVLMAPTHVNGNHWVLTVWHIPTRKHYYYDPFLKKCPADLSKRWKEYTTTVWGAPSKIKMFTVKDHLPSQKDGVSCGPLVYVMMKFIHERVRTRQTSIFPTAPDQYPLRNTNRETVVAIRMEMVEEFKQLRYKIQTKYFQAVTASLATKRSGQKRVKSIKRPRSSTALNPHSSAERVRKTRRTRKKTNFFIF